MFPIMFCRNEGGDVFFAIKKFLFKGGGEPVAFDFLTICKLLMRLAAAATNCTYARLVYKSCWKIAERQEIIFLKLSTSDFSDKRRAKLCAFAWKVFFCHFASNNAFFPLIYLYFSSSKSTTALLLPSRNICSPEFSFPLLPPNGRRRERGGLETKKNFSHLGAFLLLLLFQVRRLRRL